MDITSCPKISIVTVSYNSEQTIENTILSVLDQTYNSIEYIIIDGNSTDNTKSIISKHSTKIKKFISEPDAGIYDAMNKSLLVAEGDWLLFLGSDDVLVSTTIIEEVVKHFQNNDTIYYGNVLFKRSNSLYEFNLNKWSLCLRNICHQSIFYPFQCYKNYKYDLHYNVFADHIYNIIVYGKRIFEFKHINKTIAIYNDVGRSSFIYDTNYFNELPATVRKYLGFKYALYVKLRLAVFKFKKYIINK